MSSPKEKEGVARELADEQQQASIAEFFEKNKQMLGFGSKNRALVTAIKEGVDNSLDAAEEARILPDIMVDVSREDEYYTITIEDNGPGIPKDSVPSVFGKLLYGSRFHREMQQRGQQGIGISAAVLYSQLTSGNPARVLSKTKNSQDAYYVEIGIDTDNNDAIVHREERREWSEKDHGIRIELDMEANLRARKRLHRYIRNTAVANPHATIQLTEPKGELIFDDRPVDELPDEVEEIRPHPHGVELGTLLDMLEKTKSRKIKTFLKQEFTRVGEKTAQEIVNNFKDKELGRFLGWKIESDSISRQDYVDAISNVVHGKGKEETRTFADEVYNNLQENKDYASFIDVSQSVSKASETANELTGKQFADTVQEKTKQAVWGVIKGNVEYTVSRVTNRVTVDRKSDNLVSLFAEEFISRILNKGCKILTYNELVEIAESASDDAAEQHSGKGSFGGKARKKVIDELWEKSATATNKSLSISDVSQNRSRARNLLKGMRESNAMAPPKKCISPIGESHIVKGMKSRYSADFYTASTRSAKVANGKPFVVESGIAYGGDIDPDGQIKLERFANRVPLVYQQGACAITKNVKEIEWNNYYKGSDKLSQNSGSLPQGPMILIVHIASTNVPFTSESKDAVANVPEMEKEIELAVRESARNLKSHLKKQRTRRQREQKRDVIGGLLSDMTDKIENITGEDIRSKKESQARILNNVFIRKSGKKTVRVDNFGSRKRDVVLSIHTEEGKLRNRSLSVRKNESESASIPEEIKSIEVEEPNEAQYTLKD